MPSNHLILCCPFLLLLSIFPNIRVFSDESALHIRWPRYWSISISPSIEYSGLISFRIDWFDLLAVQRLSRALIIVWHLETISFSLVWSVILFFVLDVVRLAENQHKPFPKGSHVDNLWSQLSTVETSFFEALWKGREKERKRERKEEIQHPSLCFRWAGGNEVLSILSGREKASLCISPLGWFQSQQTYSTLSQDHPQSWWFLQPLAFKK